MDIKHKQLYVAYDKHTDMFKVGAASNVRHRLSVLSSAIRRPLELIFETPGSDYFMREIPLSRATHPVKHDGYHEWYHNTPEFRAFLDCLLAISRSLDVSGIVAEMMHKYTE